VDVHRSRACELGSAARDYHFHSLSDEEALFRYDIRTLPTEIDAHTPIGSSTLFAAWNAASYVAQIEDGRFAKALSNDQYLEATREALQRHQGLWFNDEIYLISRRSRLN